MNYYFVERRPQNINSETQLLIMLHGYGSNEQDLFSFVEDLPQDWWVISLRAPKEAQLGGFSWFDLNLNDIHHFFEKSEVTNVLQSLMKFIKKIREEYQLVNRIHLMGFSQGAILIYALALSYPEYFHKVCILSGFASEELLPPKITNKEDLKKMKFFISHGMEDGVIPLEWARLAAPMLTDRKVKFTFREYRSGHNVNQKNYMDLVSFLHNELEII